MTGAQVAGGSGGVSAVRVQAFARENTVDRPHGVVNDYVGSTLARLAGVPVPPGTLVEFGGGKQGYLSLAFSHRGDTPPPVILSTFATGRPWECAGIILADQWIANGDRHDDNLAYLPSQGVAAFDHDLALLGRAVGDVADVLRETRDQEVLRHPLAPYVASADYFEAWASRIGGIMTEEIRRVVGDCVRVDLISAEVGAELVTFLDHRKSRVLDYLSRTAAEYSGVGSWPFGVGTEVGS